ncbi:MAG: hypothetical protein P4L50_18235 [Anaerolineaceae bacterium]|nr:hypothetical protein [Anaerolineaceae bacterium]
MKSKASVYKLHFGGAFLIIIIGAAILMAGCGTVVRPTPTPTQAPQGPPPAQAIPTLPGTPTLNAYIPTVTPLPSITPFKPVPPEVPTPINTSPVR